MSKKRLYLILIAVISAILCLGIISANAEENEGVTFSETDYYKAHLALSSLPSTYEAFISFPENIAQSTVGGVIIGNYKNTSTAGFSFEIASKGNPRLFIIDDAKKQYDFTFGKVNVYTGKPLHLAITKDTAKGEVTCYVDGEAVQTLKLSSPKDITMSNPVMLGGDYRNGNTNYFKGSVSKFAMYYTVRTPDQIKVDAMGKYGTNNIVGFYEVSKEKKILESAIYSSVRFIHSKPWAEKEPAKDYAYSFAVVGDTQILTMTYPSLYKDLYNWIKENAEAKKIKYVFGLGDITNNSTAGEWQLAKKFMTSLNGIVPYSFVRGNHDTVEMFNRYFPYSEFGSTVDGSFDGTMLNTYKNFEVGKVKYMIMCLDMEPSNDVLQWADRIAEENPDRNIIVTTHGYLYQNRVITTNIWPKFAKKHKNICMIIAGHDPCDLIVNHRSVGDNGNTVTELLIDPQNGDRYVDGGLGMVAMLYFSEDGTQMEIEYISTKNNKYYLEENQYKMTVNMLKTKSEETTAPKVETKAPETDNTVNIPENTPSQSYIIWVAVGVAAGAIAVTAITVLKNKNKKQ